LASFDRPASFDKIVRALGNLAPADDGSGDLTDDQKAFEEALDRAKRWGDVIEDINAPEILFEITPAGRRRLKELEGEP
jgi:hypothetical protein